MFFIPFLHLDFVKDPNPSQRKCSAQTAKKEGKHQCKQEAWFSPRLKPFLAIPASTFSLHKTAHLAVIRARHGVLELVENGCCLYGMPAGIGGLDIGPGFPNLSIAGTSLAENGADHVFSIEMRCTSISTFTEPGRNHLRFLSDNRLCHDGSTPAAPHAGVFRLQFRDQGSSPQPRLEERGFPLRSDKLQSTLAKANEKDCECPRESV